MSRVFILNDCQNLFHRQAHMVNPALGVDSMVGMALHMILYSMKKEWTTFNGTHAVCFMEGKSWRKNIYPAYKADRAVKFATLSEKDREDHKILQEAFDDLMQYISKNTNITVLRNPNAEADDMVAVFVEAHPDDKHILISSDSDFYQLLRHGNLIIYDPVKDIRIQQDGVYNDAGEKLSFTINGGKLKIGQPDPSFVTEDKWYEYALFIKCIRGDATDNIFSAFPGVREKGTKNTIGIREAYHDQENMGYLWNNFFMQRWIDHNGVEQQVKTCFDMNKRLIDLSLIPDNIKIECIQNIVEQTEKPPVPASDIGTFFYKFVGKWNLTKIGNNAAQFMPMLKSKYIV